MDTMLKSLYVEFKSDGKSCWISMHAEFTDELRAQADKGMYSLWFVVDEVNLKRFGSTYDTLEDGYHKLNLMGDTCVFYDLDCFPSRKNYGTVDLKFAQVWIPIRFRRLIGRIARKVFANFRRYQDSGSPWNIPVVRIDFSLEQRQRFVRIYGQGKGRVRVRLGRQDGMTRSHMKKCLRSDRKALEVNGQQNTGPLRYLHEMLERVRCIARNSTTCTSDVAEVLVSKDLDSFFWVARTPRGRTIMNGGIIQHSRDPNQPDWSIHT